MLYAEWPQTIEQPRTIDTCSSYANDLVTSNEEPQRALEDIAEQYRKMAERLEYKLQELQRN